MAYATLPYLSPINRLAPVAEYNRHHYHPLPTSDAIRVLEIHPGTRDEPVSCSLLPGTRLTETTPFRALSYCWGDATDTEEIWCDGMVLLVTRNLLGALQGLRSEHHRVRMWVDAICINQHDIAERNRQVSMMRQIYSQAEHVDVWLGDASDTTPEAVRLIETMAMGWCESAYGSMDSDCRTWWADRLQTEDHTSGIISQTSLATSIDRSDPSWRALATYFRRAWFGRVWVIQELQSSRRAWIHCGGTQLEWEFVALVARWANFKQLEQFLDSHIRSRGVAQAQTIHEKLCTARKVPFLHALARARNSVSVDKRDKVFSMLQHEVQVFGRQASGKVMSPMSGGGEEQALFTTHLDLRADYNMTTSAVFCEVAIRAITSSGSLEVLDYVYLVETAAPICPFWVPRWDLSAAYIPPPSPSFLFRASGDKAMDVLHISPSTLTVRGVRVDTVLATDNKMPISPSPSSDSIFDTDCKLGEDPLAALSRLLNFDTFGGVYDDERTLHRALDNLDAHFADFAAFLVDALPDKPATKRYIPLIRHWCDICLQPLDCSISVTSVRPARWICAVCNSYDLCQRCYESGEHDSTHELRYAPITSICVLPSVGLWERLEVASKSGNAARFKSRVRSHVWLKSFFRTRSGWVGMGPSSMRRDDVVAVLFGADTPFIMRREPSGESRYRVVGPCYVHGMMDGEAVEMCAGGGLTEEYFELI